METTRHPWPIHRSTKPKQNQHIYQNRQPVVTMFRRAKTTAMAPHYDSEVRVQKVGKIQLVRNLVTKPSMYYGNPKAAGTTMRRGAAEHGASKSVGASRPGVVSIEDINKRSEAYIRERKRQFLGLK
uniref:Uncharacterized protein n=1 Tax=Avena sativa TaxID=4498 RepID=A0ACD5W2B0_AVESA